MKNAKNITDIHFEYIDASNLKIWSIGLKFKPQIHSKFLKLMQFEKIRLNLKKKFNFVLR